MHNDAQTDAGTGNCPTRESGIRKSEALRVETEVVVDIKLVIEFNIDVLTALVSHCLRCTDAKGSWLIAIALVGDERLRDLHREFMGIDEETDVMTFPSEPEPEEEEGRGGDIVISVERAAEQARERGHSIEHEVSFLVVHGLLHLLGWEDTTVAQREEMLAYQARLLVEFDAALFASAEN